jgi:hypothetical protein
MNDNTATIIVALIDFAGAVICAWITRPRQPPQPQPV